MILLRLFLILLFVFSACADDSSNEDPIYLAPPEEGKGIQMAFDYVAPPNQEIWMCYVFELELPDPYMYDDWFANVNRVESVQNVGMHHMTLSALDPTKATLDAGWYDCNDLYEENMGNLIMIYGAGASQNREELTLPEGIVATVPNGVTLIHEVHFVNVTEKEEKLFSRVNAYTIPKEEVKGTIYGDSIRDQHVNLPAGETVTEWTRCVMNKDIDLLFMASHTHQLGINFSVKRFDGENVVGDIFYETNDWHDPYIMKFEEPLFVPAGEGFEYSCTWKNTTNELVEYGSTAEHEMCNLTLVHTPGDFDICCEVVDSSDGEMWVKPGNKCAASTAGN